MEANSVPGLVGCIAISAQPVSSFTYKILFQVFPPSIVLYNPLCVDEFQSGPGADTYTVFLSVGSIIILLILSVLSNPIFCQLFPPSVVLYIPSP